MTKPRSLAVVLLLLLTALLSSACIAAKNPEGWASPTVTDQSLYYLQGRNRIAAVSIPREAAATTTWSFPDARAHPDQKDLELNGVYTEPVAEGDYLYFAGYDGDVFAVARADGLLRWHAKRDRFDGSIVGGPVLAGDVLVFGTTEGRLYGLARSDGATAPGWPADGVHVPGDGVWAPPVVVGDKVIAATMSGEVFAYASANGAEAWHSPFKSTGAIADLALLDADRLFVPSLTGQVAILNAADGAQVGPTFKAGDWVWTRPAFANGVAYFGDFGGKVYALDVASMQPKWTYATENRVKAAPAVIDGVVVVADRKPIVHFLSADTGEMLNRVPLEGAGTVRAGLAVEGGRAIVATTEGRLFSAEPQQRAVVPVDVKAVSR